MRIKKYINKKNRRKILPFAVGILVIILPILFLSLKKPSTTAAAWFNENWLYRTPLDFNNSSTAVSAERKVKFDIDTATLITTGQLQSSCQDIRFTDYNGNILPHYLDSGGGACNTSSTDYYVLLPRVEEDDNIVYMYYGNASALDTGVEANFSATTFTPGSGPNVGTEEVGEGPVAYWKFDESANNRCSDGTSDACDATAGKNDGVITNGTAWMPPNLCVGKTCLYFDGTDDIVTVTNASEIDMNNSLAENYTINFWVKVISDGEANQGEIFDKGATTYCRTTNEASGLVDLECSMDLATTDATLTVTDGLTVGKWHNVSLQYTDDADDEITIYIDGINKGSSTNGVGSPATDTDNLIIGGDTSNNFNGFIDEFKIYPYIRSASQLSLDNIISSQGTSTNAIGVEKEKTLSDGLVGYWQMDDNVSGDSQTITDSIGGINDGTTDYGANTSGMDCTVQGKYAQGCGFDGTDDVIEAGSNSILNITGDLTVSFWFETDTTGGGGTEFFLSNTVSNSAQNYTFEVHRTAQRLSTVWGDNLILTSNTNVEANTWYHATLVRSGSSGNWDVKIYLNGQEDGSTTTSIDPNGGSAGTVIGALRDTVARTNFFEGTMDEVRIYNRALSAGEIQELYKTPPPPVAYYNFDENKGTALYDYSGNDFVGTLNNFPTDPWVKGRFGSALVFDRANDDVNLGTTSTLDIVDNLTISAWIYPTDWGEGSTNKYGTIFARQNGFLTGYQFEVIDNNGVTPTETLVMYNGSQSISTSDNVLNLNEWQHVAVVVENEYATFYINGQPYDGGSFTLDTEGSQTAYIGSYDGNNDTFSGNIDEVKVYNYARTSAQIIEDMNAGHPIGGSPIGSQAIYWKFDEMYGTTANDTRGNQNGTIDSGATWVQSSGCKINGCLQFDAAGEEVLIALANDAQVDYNGSENFSGTAWVYIETMPSTSDQDGIITKWDETSTFRGYRLVVENDDADTTGNFQIELYDESANQSIVATGAADTITENRWYHVGFTFNGGTAGTAGDLKLYVDGIEVGSNSLNASFLGLEDINAVFAVGEYDSGDTEANNTAFTGKIDEVKIYAGELTKDEIGIDMNANSSTNFGSTVDEKSYLGIGNTGPVAYWNFDEKTGSVANDISGNGNVSSTFTGDVTFERGKFGSAVYFDGTNDVVRIVEDASIDFDGASDDFTLGAWFKTEANYSANAQILGRFANFQTYYLIYMNSSEQICFDLSDNSVFPSICSTETFNDGKWHSAHGVRDAGNTLYLYVDGVLRNQTSDTTGAISNGDNYSIGNGGVTPDPYEQLDWNGYIDEAKVFNYPLSQAQIAYEHNRGLPVAYWKMDECQGTNINDSSGNGNNGTLTIGASGTNTTEGTCSSGTGSEAWNNGTTGSVNASMDFDGTNDYISVTNADEFNYSATEPFSISGWVVVDTDSTGTIVNKDEAWQLIYEATFDYLNFSEEGTSGGDGLACGEIDSVELGNWYFFTVVHEGDGSGTVSCYLDGNLEGSRAGVDSAENSNPLYIGASYNGGSPIGYLDGQIDEIKIFNYALTPNQVKILYNNGAVFFK